MRAYRSKYCLLVLVLLMIVPAIAQQGREVRVRPKGDLVELPGRSKRWALIIGVDKYDSTRITPLIGASNDAERLAEALVKYAGFPADQVVVISSSQPEALKPKRNIIIERLANLNGVVPEDGLFLFAFSGHGTEAEEKGYLLPSDAVSAERNARFLDQTAIPVNYVREEIRAFGVRQVIVLLDSCRNDPRADKAGGDNLMAAPLAESFDFDRRNSEVEGFVTFYATRSRMRAYEDPVRRQGYFSYTFIEGLSGRAANERGEVKLAGLIRYLEEKVPLYVRRDQGARAQQSPRTVVEGYRASDLVLSVTAPPNPPPTPASTAEAIELAFWNSISGSENVEDFEAYIETYPNGRFIRLAHNRREQLLTKVGGRPDPSPVSAPEIKPAIGFTRTAFTTGKLVNGNLVKSQGNCDLYVENLGNGVKIEMVRIPAGKFIMGSPTNEEGRANVEGPQHEVAVSDFLMGRFEVTQKLWRAVAGFAKVAIDLNPDPSSFKGDELPVEMVSWNDAKEFIARLNRKLGLNEKTGYRLPSEAEWEYAARAGTTTPFTFGTTISPDLVNYAGSKTIEVGSLGFSNGWGLFDMHGNVWEWCEDSWHYNYNGAPTDGRPWIDAADSDSLIRGCGWFDRADICRSANRVEWSPNHRDVFLGFRLVRIGR